MSNLTRREQDLRYIKTEVAITSALINHNQKGVTPNIADLCRKAQIKTSTFYRHYSSTDDFFVKSKNRILRDFEDQKSNSNFLDLKISSIFLFVIKNKERFLALPYSHTLEIMKEFTREFEENLHRIRTGLPAIILERILIISAYELLGILRIWNREQDFNIEKISYYKKYYSFLITNHVKNVQI